jgi:hypothetical protein
VKINDIFKLDQEFRRSIIQRVIKTERVHFDNISSDIPIKEISHRSFKSETDLIFTQLEEIQKSTDNDTIIKINPYNVAPLSFAVLLPTTSKGGKVIVSKNGVSDIVFESDDSIIEAYGLSTGSKCTITVIDDKNNQIYQEVMPPINNNGLFSHLYPVVDKSSHSDSLYFVAYAPESGCSLSGYDSAGDMRFHITGMLHSISSGFHASEYGTFIINHPNTWGNRRSLKTSGIIEISPAGRIIKEIIIPGGISHKFHVVNGILYTPGTKPSLSTSNDTVIKIDISTGEILDRFHLSDIIPQNQGRSEHWSQARWCHLNSVYYDDNSNSITISCRHLDIVLNYDDSTKNINWVMGDKETWSNEKFKSLFLDVDDLNAYHYAQHSASYDSLKGEVYLFDNGNQRSKVKRSYINPEVGYSRGIHYSLNLIDRKCSVIWEFGKDKGSSHYSPYISSLEKNGNRTLVNFGGSYNREDGSRANEPAFLYKNTKRYANFYDINTDTDEINTHFKFKHNVFAVYEVPCKRFVNLEKAEKVLKFNTTRVPIFTTKTELETTIKGYARLPEMGDNIKVTAISSLLKMDMNVVPSAIRAKQVLLLKGDNVIMLDAVRGGEMLETTLTIGCQLPELEIGLYDIFLLYKNQAIFTNYVINIQ